MAADPTLARLARRGADFAEFFEERSSSLLVHLEDGRVQKVLQGDESGLGLRVLCRRPDLLHLLAAPRGGLRPRARRRTRAA